MNESRSCHVTSTCSVRAGAAAAAGTACRGQYVWLAGAEASEVDDNGFLQLLIACRNQVHRLSG